MSEQTFYTVEQAAELLQVHPNTVYRLLNQKKISYYAVGVQKRIPVSEIERLKVPADDSNSLHFISDAHKAFYNAHKAITDRGDDYEALIYTLGISESCREHFKDLYDEKNRIINTDALKDTWQTTGSKAIFRLAINLFSWETAEGDDPANYAPKRLFRGLDDKHRTGALYAMKYFA